MKLPIKLRRPSLNTLLWIAGGFAVACIIAFGIWWFWDHDIVIFNEPDGGFAGPVSRVTGLPCERADKRPFAVMLAADPVARPLSSIGQADFVLEMPVTPNGVTRLMAVYQCQEPEEIGSIRSAREGFLPYVAMFNAIYAHWGGEAGALEQLNRHILDNIDAMKYEGRFFYRKKGVKPPHNGFTSYEKLVEGAQALSYMLDDGEFGFTHTNAKPPKNLSTIATTITLPYGSPYDVRWSYDEEHNAYARFRNNTPELDAATGEPVTASVVMVLHAPAQPFGDQYLTIATQGGGQATVYQNGITVSGTWRKDASRLDAPLELLDGRGEVIPLAPGIIWVSFIAE